MRREREGKGKENRWEREGEEKGKRREREEKGPSREREEKFDRVPIVGTNRSMRSAADREQLVLHVSRNLVEEFPALSDLNHFATPPFCLDKPAGTRRHSSDLQFAFLQI